MYGLRVYVQSLVVAHRSIIAIVRCQSHFPVSVMKSLPMLLPVFAAAEQSKLHCPGLAVSPCDAPSGDIH
ncbi:unnamed protein product [Lasius platythorax]|uniref:Uncharacterized protein n=1 Tax=Lasius platythorax TaxID=488582 RepID=A0AAV2N2W9_9HYME